MKIYKIIITLLSPLLIFLSPLLIPDILPFDSISVYPIYWILTIVWIIVFIKYKFCNIWLLPTSFLLHAIISFVLAAQLRNFELFWLLEFSIFHSFPFFVITLIVAAINKMPRRHKIKKQVAKFWRFIGLNMLLFILFYLLCVIVLYLQYFAMEWILIPAGVPYGYFNPYIELSIGYATVSACWIAAMIFTVLIHAEKRMITEKFEKKELYDTLLYVE